MYIRSVIQYLTTMKSFKNVNVRKLLDIPVGNILFHIFMIAPIMMITGCYSVSITKRKHNSGYHVSLTRNSYKTLTNDHEQSINHNFDDDNSFEDLSYVSVDNNQVELFPEMNVAQNDDFNITDLEMNNTNEVHIVSKLNQFTRPVAPLSDVVVNTFFKGKGDKQVVDETQHESGKSNSDFGYGLLTFFSWLFLIGGFALLLIGLLSGPDLLIVLLGVGSMILALILMVNTW